MTRRRVRPSPRGFPGLCLASVLLVALSALASPAFAAGRSNEPLDFRYRVLGSEIAVGIVFDDGRDVFIQPLDPALAPRLRVNDAPFVLQGPYLVVRGLANRLSLAADGDRLRSATIEYAGPGRTETIARDCTLRARELQSRLHVPFGTGALAIEPGGVDQLSQMLAQARGADRVTLVAFADRAHSPIAQRRIARVRELLVAGGIPAGSIEHRVQPPSASTLEVIATRRVDHGCEPVRQAVVATATAAAAAAATAPARAAPEAPAALAAELPVASPPPPAVALAAPVMPVALAAPVDRAQAQASMTASLSQVVSANPELARPVSDEDRRKAVQQIMALAAQGRISDPIAAALVVAAARSQSVAPGVVPVPLVPPLAVAALTGPAAPSAPNAPSAPSAASAPAAERAAPAQNAIDPLRLLFLPNSTVQATLRSFLRLHGFDVEFRSMPLLMIEDVAEVNGADLREVLRRALTRLGLRGEIQGNRLLVVELAN